MENAFKVEDKYVIQILDTGRHEYAKFDLQFIVDLNVSDWITEYSKICHGHTPLNHFKSTFIECDVDLDTVIRGMKFYNPNVEIEFDHETLTNLFEEKYDDHRDWLNEENREGRILIPFDTEYIFDVRGYENENELDSDRYRDFEFYMNKEDEEFDDLVEA